MVQKGGGNSAGPKWWWPVGWPVQSHFLSSSSWLVLMGIFARFLSALTFSSCLFWNMDERLWDAEQRIWKDSSEWVSERREQGTRCYSSLALGGSLTPSQTPLETQYIYSQDEEINKEKVWTRRRCWLLLLFASLYLFLTSLSLSLSEYQSIAVSDERGRQLSWFCYLSVRPETTPNQNGR